MDDNTKNMVRPMLVGLDVAVRCGKCKFVLASKAAEDMLEFDEAKLKAEGMAIVMAKMGHRC